MNDFELLELAADRGFCDEVLQTFGPETLPLLLKSMERFGYAQIKVGIDAINCFETGWLGATLVFGFDPRKVEDFHVALYRCIDLQERANTGEVQWVELPGTGFVILEDLSVRVGSFESALKL